MNNITLETANFSDQLGIYDFFNVLVSGATFIFGLCVINTKINDYLWNDVDISKGLGIVLLIYLTGIILQELGSIWDSKCRKLYKQMNSSILKGNILDDESGMPVNEIIENPLLLKQYRSYADKLLNCLGALANKENCFDKDFVSGFLLVCFSATRTPGSAGESKKNYIVKRPSGIMEVRSANCTNKIRGGLFRWKKT